ncbi:threonine aldolase family protein [Paenibacillus paeoniae]|uniref:Aromatic amino acid beta-eliminating lyase/threonine aldolase domain-containing protein n=1 Tax=Paenibacillus paeoniae TaxID=2292705 RepID=A0A371P6P7_9BACL|nr:GntG family PLP-dependent aldolase [Paenibacillus paeoniae]REK71613.1 hypothetical protein DX130_21745 [Paenibacillus paeoniae]
MSLIDLYSDNSSKPSEEMKKVMLNAEIYHTEEEDIMVKKLEEKLCSILGKESSIFLPTGTMCNELAFLSFCESRGRILLDHYSEPLLTKQGGLASHLGVYFQSIVGNKGVFSSKEVRREYLKPHSASVPPLKLIYIEQTAAENGGSVWSVDSINDVCKESHQRGLKVYMDGARLFNAAPATGQNADVHVKNIDAVYIDLCKGLGAPTGAMLAGDKEFIEKVWEWKRRIGATWRKVGMLAAAGLYALNNNIERIKEDNFNAITLYKLLNDSELFDIDRPETNIIFINLNKTNVKSNQLAHFLLNNGIRVSVPSESKIRLVTHMDIRGTDLNYIAKMIIEGTKTLKR